MDLELLKNFYLGEEPEVETLFDMWERGEARDDSITPSAFCPEYRAWMVQRIHRLLHTTGGRDVLSVGCGNGFIEAELHKAGLSVLAIDVMPVAVRLARRKGVNAVVGDARRWRPPHEHWDLIYADGLLGHLIEPALGDAPILRRFRHWLAPSQGRIIISNGVPNEETRFVPAQNVPGFYWLSQAFIVEALGLAGYTISGVRLLATENWAEAAYRS